MSEGLNPIAVSYIVAGHLGEAIDALKDSKPHVVGTLSILLEVEQNKIKHMESLRKLRDVVG